MTTFISELFTDTAGHSLDGHAVPVGGPWVPMSGSAGKLVFTNSPAGTRLKAADNVAGYPYTATSPAPGDGQIDIAATMYNVDGGIAQRRRNSRRLDWRAPGSPGKRQWSGLFRCAIAVDLSHGVSATRTQTEHRQRSLIPPIAIGPSAQTTLPSTSGTTTVIRASSSRTLPLPSLTSPTQTFPGLRWPESTWVLLSMAQVQTALTIRDTSTPARLPQRTTKRSPFLSQRCPLTQTTTR
jgi:hypothetical protein